MPLSVFLLTLCNKSLGSIRKPSRCISLYTPACSSNVGLLYLVYPLTILSLLDKSPSSPAGCSVEVPIGNFKCGKSRSLKKPWEALHLFISRLLLFNHCWTFFVVAAPQLLPSKTRSRIFVMLLNVLVSSRLFILAFFWSSCRQFVNMSDDPYCLFKIFAQQHPDWFTNDGVASLSPYNLKKMGKAITSLLVSLSAR